MFSQIHSITFLRSWLKNQKQGKGRLSGGQKSPRPLSFDTIRYSTGTSVPLRVAYRNQFAPFLKQLLTKYLSKNSLCQPRVEGTVSRSQANLCIGSHLTKSATNEFVAERDRIVSSRKPEKLYSFIHLHLLLILLLVGCGELDLLTESAQQSRQAATVVEIIPNREPAFEQTHVSRDGAVFIAPSYLSERSQPASDEKTRLVAVTMTLGNKGAADIEIGAEAVRLIDADGNRYAPAKSSLDLVPALVNTVLLAQDSIYGAVEFTIPTHVKPAAVELCLDGSGACEVAIHASIPLPE